MRVGTGLRTAELESSNVRRRIFIRKGVKVGYRSRLMCSKNWCDSGICRPMATLFRVEQRRNAKRPLTAGTPLGSVDGSRIDLKRVTNYVATQAVSSIIGRAIFSKFATFFVTQAWKRLSNGTPICWTMCHQ